MSGKIGALVLAAGASTRMNGVIKQLLPWGTTTLLEHAVAQTRFVSEEVYVVLGANAATITKKLDLDTEVILNPNWGSGLGSSIVAGVQHIMAKDKTLDGLLIILADQPLIDSAFLSELKKLFVEHKDIAATYYGTNLGVPAIFRKNLFPELLKLNYDFGAKAIIEKHKKNVIGLDPEGKTVDIDTREKYQQLIDKLNH